MVDERVQDLSHLDADVARAVDALTRWRAALAGDPARYADVDPFDGLRHVAGKSTWKALGALAPSAAETPLRDALLGWIRWLIQARIGEPDDVAHARTAAEPLGKLAGEEPRLVSWGESWRGMVFAKKAGEARLWMEAAAGAAPSLAQVGADRAARRLEVARRLGFEHPWDGWPLPGRASLRSAALRVLDATEDISSAVWKETLGVAREAPSVIHAAVAREAGDGWPPQVSARWLDEAFRGLARSLPLRLPPLPRAVGASSFARALVTFGFAVRVATSPTAAAFALTREPGAVSAHRLGLSFGTLACDREFHTRVLGLGVRRASANARVLARTALFETRMAAARLLLGDDAAFAPRDVFEELGVRIFGSVLPPSVRGAWPTPREDEASRFVALLETPALRAFLRERFDVDWFLNPRAWELLRARGPVSASERIPDTELGSAAAAVARSLETALA